MGNDGPRKVALPLLETVHTTVTSNAAVIEVIQREIGLRLFINQELSIL
jgi:hypothetical protein